MNKNLFFLLMFMLCCNMLFSQVAINRNNLSPNASAMLDVQDTAKGVLIPRMTIAQRNLIASPASGLLVFQTNNVPGFYYNAGTSGSPSWKLVGTGTDWSITGNSGTSAGTNFIGTTDNVPLIFKVNNETSGKIEPTGKNTALGYQSLKNNSVAYGNTSIGSLALLSQSFNPGGAYYTNNTAIGYMSLYTNQPTSSDNGKMNTAIGGLALYNNTTGSSNTAVGNDCLGNNSTGNNNTAIGIRALMYNTTGHFNSAVGAYALYGNTNQSNLVAVGDSALSNNNGVQNTAVGSKALSFNVEGCENTALGYQSLTHNSNSIGNTAVGNLALFTQSFNSGYSYYSHNTAVGNQSMYHNQPTTTVNGRQNTAIGGFSLYNNTSGSCNTVAGFDALGTNTTGNNNTACGFRALMYNSTGYSNVAVGTQALYSNTSSSNLVAVGDSALYDNFGSQNTAIGSKTLRNNLDGYYNSATGYLAMYNNLYGSFNSAFGTYAQYSNDSGYYNTAIGVYANYYADNSNNTSVGYSAGDWYNFSNGTFLGSNAYATLSGLSNCMALGYDAHVNASNKVVVGNASVTSIGGYAGWTNFSDGRYKMNVSDDVPGLEFIRKLRPVIYNIDVAAIYRDQDKNKSEFSRMGDTQRKENPVEPEFDGPKSKILYTGFIAQEVEAAAQSIGYDFSGVDRSGVSTGGYYGLRYAEFVVPLVKAVQEQQEIIEQQQRQIDELMIKVRELEQE